MRVLAFLWCVFYIPIYGQFNPNSFHQYILDNPVVASRSSNDVVQNIPELASYINWTTGYVVTEYKVPITYSDPNIGRNIANLTSKLHQEMSDFVLGAVRQVQVSSVFFVKDYFRRDSKIQTSLLSTLYSLPIENAVVKGSFMTGTLSFPFFGTNSISAPFYNNIKTISVTNYLTRETASTPTYDTLVIDMVMFPNFKPSLLPQIMDQNSNIVHSAATVDRDVLLKRGPVHFVGSITEAFNHPLRGKNVAYVLPARTTGAFESDVILFNTDVKRLFAQKRSIDSFQQGNVIIIVPQVAQIDVTP